jgi:anthranilate synthase/aminodeoxychorismate synthase-like glutamine amidotransferase
MLLLIDNYDSFVFNLARYFERLGQPTNVVRNDRIDAAAIRVLRPAAVILSPGPCAPEQAGCSLDVVRELHAELPILGICLGHQTIAAALGGRVERAAEPVHGRTSLVEHDALGVFAGLPSPLVACRYHSLVVAEESLPAELRVTARTPDGVVMGLAHASLPVVGVQFHPESILTDHGYAMLANFLQMAGIAEVAAPPDFTQELRGPSLPAAWQPDRPVTF